MISRLFFLTVLSYKELWPLIIIYICLGILLILVKYFINYIEKKIHYPTAEVSLDVTVLSKQQKTVQTKSGVKTVYFITFASSEGETKEFETDASAYDSVNENDFGKLKFKEEGGSRMFISFSPVSNM